MFGDESAQNTCNNEKKSAVQEGRGKLESSDRFRQLVEGDYVQLLGLSIDSRFCSECRDDGGSHGGEVPVVVKNIQF